MSTVHLIFEEEESELATRLADILGGEGPRLVTRTTAEGVERLMQVTVKSEQLEGLVFV